MTKTIWQMARRGAMIMAAAAALAACSNDPAEQDRLKAITAAFQGLLQGADDKKGGIPAPDGVLAATTAPVILLVNDDQTSAVYFLQIQTNGAYQTFANAARQSVTLNNGFLTGTRGLSDDLMSSDIAHAQQLIAHRRAGTATRVMRHLDGEDHIRTETFRCDVTPGQTSQVAFGAVSTPAQLMNERCASDARTITNTYLVSPAGMVVQSRQWVSPAIGYTLIQHVRL